jgi:uridine phosphorylase
VRYITPKAIVNKRFDNKNTPPKWDTAIICFRDIKGSYELVTALKAKPFGRKVFWGMEESKELPFVFSAKLAKKNVCIITRCLWGAPQAAILIEELSALGVKQVIGFGAAGSLEASIRQGTQIVITSAMTNDGTSCHYSKFKKVTADRNLLKLCGEVLPVKAATIDALYRETKEHIASLKRKGAQVINMEAGAFYSAAKKCRLKVIWLGHISDNLAKKWNNWYVDRKKMNNESIKNCINLIEKI